jgi:hypothetical protein
MRAQPRPWPFVVGCGRSGTTLLGAMIDAHPGYTMVHEGRFLIPLLQHSRAWRTRGGGFDVHSIVRSLYHLPHRLSRLSDMGVTLPDLLRHLPRHAAEASDAARLVFGAIAELRGFDHYAEKTPGYVHSMQLIADELPEARFVHIVRDGRDVGTAMLNNPMGPTGFKSTALHWRYRVTAASRFAQRSPHRCYEVRYEDLVVDTESVLKGICEFLEMDFHPQMLRFHERGAVLDQMVGSQQHHASLKQPVRPGLRDWRRDLSPLQQDEFASLAGDTLKAYGYETCFSAYTFRARAMQIGYGSSHTLRRRARHLSAGISVRRKRV